MPSDALSEMPSSVLVDHATSSEPNKEKIKQQQVKLESELSDYPTSQSSTIVTKKDSAVRKCKCFLKRVSKVFKGNDQDKK